METNFKNAELNEIANILLKNGYTLLVSKSDVFERLFNNYFNFSKDNKIGYVQINRWGELSFSTVHKPCRECGTAFGIGNTFDYSEKNILDFAENCLVVYPNWASPSDRSAVVKYKSFEEYLERQSKIFGNIYNIIKL